MTAGQLPELEVCPKSCPSPASLWLGLALHAPWHLQLLHSSGGGLGCVGVEAHGTVCLMFSQATDKEV